ncbi:MAG TPA: biotin transporter BioY [Thermoleophilaceae bacterium]|nr:biotin transporter BioY [Thermoleophilaceae bacterium]
MSTASSAALPRRAVLADAIPGALARDIALVIGGAAFMALMAQLTIKMPGELVPITGQTLAVGLIGATLGARRGVSAMSLYAIAGLFLPVYADGGSGWDVIWGASGGYIVGFILATYVIGLMAERGADRKFLTAFAAFVAAQLIIFGIGVPWLKVAADLSWGDAIHSGFTIFILGGLIKAAIGAAVLPSAWHFVRKAEKR